MRFVNVRELHNQTPKVLARVKRGQKTIVTQRGKPTVLMIPLTEDQIEDIVFSSPSFLKELEAAEREADRKGTMTTEELRKRLSH